MRIDELQGTKFKFTVLISANRPLSGDARLRAVPERRPPWQREMGRLMRATNPASLLPLVYAAETALFLRCQELSDLPDTIEERQAIRAATNDLLDVKIHRLKWPDYRRSHLAIVQ
jgi:hypothetical protein